MAIPLAIDIAAVNVDDSTVPAPVVTNPAIFSNVSFQSICRLILLIYSTISGYSAKFLFKHYLDIHKNCGIKSFKLTSVSVYLRHYQEKYDSQNQYYKEKCNRQAYHSPVLSHSLLRKPRLNEPHRHIQDESNGRTA